MNEESELVLHAERELRLAGMFDKDADYNGELAPTIVEVVKAFSKYGHSGASALIVINILEKLLRFQTLTPINSNPDEWMEVGEAMWQSKRNPAMFSKDGGKTGYDIDDNDNDSNDVENN